ncbi:Hypothetical protein SRAE_2000438400 [Strongyloides ratti]|uniref:Secreted protein n=1 Tax=Strongyloides ratti TaxID=34506 RepID=A0A090LJ60_STRRB|nr:Hypothetical protein SRAE_2000438400 [Strongyloides ratti]CEF69738.1 Hypothetical protein SRAE_2000438400 [Strongyloides ratti]
MSGNVIIYLFKKLIALTVSILYLAQAFLNIILRKQNNRISELPFHIKEGGLDMENNTPIMDDISSSTLIFPPQLSHNGYTTNTFKETGGLLNNTTIYDYQRSQMLQNHKRIEEAMRIKIEKEEEERIKAEALAAEEQDFFKDMIPEIKGRKLIINSNNINDETKELNNSKLFSVDDKAFILPEGSAILGELDEQIDNNIDNTNEWDTEIDLDSLSKTEKEQKRKEREMRHKERLIEHQKKLKEKRSEGH